MLGEIAQARINSRWTGSSAFAREQRREQGKDAVVLTGLPIKSRQRQSGLAVFLSKRLAQGNRPLVVEIIGKKIALIRRALSRNIHGTICRACSRFSASTIAHAEWFPSSHPYSKQCKYPAA